MTVTPHLALPVQLQPGGGRLTQIGQGTIDEAAQGVFVTSRLEPALGAESPPTWPWRPALGIPDPTFGDLTADEASRRLTAGLRDPVAVTVDVYDDPDSGPEDRLTATVALAS